MINKKAPARQGLMRIYYGKIKEIENVFVPKNFKEGYTSLMFLAKETNANVI